MTSSATISSPATHQVAGVLRQRPGFAWIDSSAEGGLSLMGTDPELIVEGDERDWHRLERELEQRRSSHSGKGLAGGVAIGFFRFDGSFRFGFYDRPMLHDGTRWVTDPDGLHPVPDSSADALPSPISFRPEITEESYVAMVRQAKEYVAAGDIYQVCLAHRFSAPYAGDPWPLYLALREASPAPHAAYLALGDETILSSSPECFLKMEGRFVMTRPIKGTRPRGSSPAEDERLARELTDSAKESAELLMITDLERNDLGQVCDFGSVRVSRLLELERHPQVFHLVSTVEGTLRAGISHVAALAACFPGGSISGAPKKRALEIIRELEPAPRGLFTGAIGYFGYDGTSQFNIAIRTVVARGGRAEFHVGAGITSDSDPSQEWEETLHKAAGILKAAEIAGERKMELKNAGIC
jgi:para-aminobenzoate synthetase component 1